MVHVTLIGPYGIDNISHAFQIFMLSCPRLLQPYGSSSKLLYDKISNNQDKYGFSIQYFDSIAGSTVQKWFKNLLKIKEDFLFNWSLCAQRYHIKRFCDYEFTVVLFSMVWESILKNYNFVNLKRTFQWSSLSFPYSQTILSNKKCF